MVSKKKEKEILDKERRIERRKEELDFYKTFTATITGALAFVAGLFWRDVVNGVLDLFPKLPGLTGKIITSVVVTAVFVFIIINLRKKVKKMEKSLDRRRKELDEEKLK